MFEQEQSQIFYAQKFVEHHLRKARPKRSNSFRWGGITMGLDSGEIGLAIQQGEDEKIYSFTEDELLDGYGTSLWKVQLFARITEILNDVEAK